MSGTFETFRDPLLSLYQSAVKEVSERIGQSSPGGPGARRFQASRPGAIEDIGASIARREFKRARGEPAEIPAGPAPRELSPGTRVQVCAEWALRYIKALAAGDEKALSQLKDEHAAGPCDPAWISCLEEYRRYFDSSGKRKPIPYIRPAKIGPQIIEINADAKIAMMGDWGTGAAPAVEVLRYIAGHKADAVIHLGDVYYSGTPNECTKNFFDIVTTVLRKDGALPIFTLSGNHDMYSGGEGYYDLIAKLNAAPFSQSASFFCLRSSDKKWQLLAMDTGLHDDNPAQVEDAVTFLENDEIDWHCERIAEFPGRTILLSHHQLFSAYSPIGSKNAKGRRSATNPKLLAAFKKMAASEKIAAWYWGHEHTLSIYKPFAGLARGRCLGHGSVPVSIKDDIYTPLPDLTETPTLVTPAKLNTRGAVYNHGYALLTLRGDKCTAEYFQAAATGPDLMFDETFS